MHTGLATYMKDITYSGVCVSVCACVCTYMCVYLQVDRWVRWVATMQQAQIHIPG